MSQATLNQLYFYLTEGCNCACRHCWLAPKFDANASQYPTLAFEHFEMAVQQAKPLGLTGVKLTGGEPLLHPQISRILDYVRQQELCLTVETNGLLCTPALAAEIARGVNPFISVSIDGADAATHEWVRGVEGCFSLAQQAVRNLAEAGLRPQIIFSLMRHNADQIEAIIHLGEKLGAASLKFNIIQPTERGEKLHTQDETLSIPELISIGRRIECELSQQTKLRLRFDYPMAFRPLSRLAVPGGRGVCGIKGILGVLPAGQYALCGIGESTPELIFGEIGRDDLKEIWLNHPILADIRDGLPAKLTGICASCLMKARCLGSCVAQNYYRSRSIFAPFWFCEAADAQGLFPASRIVASNASITQAEFSQVAQAGGSPC